MADLDTIDGQLDELRAVPDNLDELIARYGERDRTLERIDDVLNALAAGTRPRTVPPLGATPSRPPPSVSRSSRPARRVSSLPPRLQSQPAPAPAPEVAAPAPKPAVDYEALFGPETVPPATAATESLGPVLSLELEGEEPPLEHEAEAAAEAEESSVDAEPTVIRSSGDYSALLEQSAAAPISARDTQPEPLPVPAVATDSAELDAVLGDGTAAAEETAEDEDGFEMMVEEDDILEIDTDELEMVDDET